MDPKYPWTYAQASGNIVDDATWQAEAAAGGCAKFSTGDGSTTFRIPEVRGEFIRGWSDGRGIDSGRILGSWQADLLRSHRHIVGSLYGYPDGGSPLVNAGTVASTTSANTSYFGSSETRPRNVTLLACIKY